MLVVRPRISLGLMDGDPGERCLCSPAPTCRGERGSDPKEGDWGDGTGRGLPLPTQEAAFDRLGTPAPQP